MIAHLPVLLAASRTPLFGNQWLALLAILACTAALMVVVRLAGRWLAATHPEAPAKPVSLPTVAAPITAPITAPTAAPAPVVPAGTPPETLAIIAACVATTFGAKARITAIKTAGPSVEMLMQQWSLEGRRQIYSSHQVR